MRILLATYFEIPKATGINTYMNILKTVLEDQGHEVDILAHHPNNFQSIYMVNTEKYIDKTDIKRVIHDEVLRYYERYFPNTDPCIVTMEIERYTYELAAALFNLSHYDVIHAQEIISARAFYRIKPKHVLLVASIHGLYSKELIYNGWVSDKASVWNYMKQQEYYGSLSPHRTIVPTKWLKYELHENFQIPFYRLKIVPYGMNVTSFLNRMNDEPSPELEAPVEKFIILCLARIDKVKGHKTLIEALGVVKEKRDDFICWFAGGSINHEFKNDLEKYRNELNLEKHIVFLGDRLDIPALLKRANVLVLPSLQDNHPFAIMEAQVTGTAIVASDVGGIPEMLKHGETGLLFEKQNAVQLADRLLELMNNPKLSQQLAANALKIGMKIWSDTNLFKHIMNIYNNGIAAMKVSKRSTVSEPLIKGRYGLTNNEGVQLNRISSLFRFHSDRVVDSGPWYGITGNLPLTYSIPDNISIKSLIDT
ncbi:glycosyltransferase family 4 protein [Paenibacillus alkalitolerans]|uniref:glycosyltransferase family 4 protein n=1 Tax=Paenibacillus alkalitolerans TaxID=2799335 RepID=UPI0018F771E3|nr:glycosyltransferase family 4 protein [Paenibacillus alkalitolerans]